MLIIGKPKMTAKVEAGDTTIPSFSSHETPLFPWVTEILGYLEIIEQGSSRRLQ